MFGLKTYMIPEGGVGPLPVVGEVSEGGPHQGLHV